jgi:hypothetical protein
VTEELPFRVLVVRAAAPLLRWQTEIVSALLAEPGVEVVGVASEGVSQRPLPRSSATARIALRVWTAITKVRARPEDPDPREPSDLPSAVADIALAEARRASHLDAIVDLTPGAAVGDVLPHAAHGRWTLAVGTRRIGDDEFAGTWEAAEGRPTTELSIQMVRANSSAIELIRSIAATRTSLPVNRDATLWRATQLFVQAIRRTGRGEQCAVPDPYPEVPVTPDESQLSLLQISRSLLRMAWRSCLTFPRRIFYREQFVIALRRSGHRAVTTSEASEFEIVVSPRNLFYADPLVLHQDEGDTIFVELYDRKTRKASIGAATINSGRVSAPQVVLQREYHLSYPFVFHDGDGIFMIPETSAVHQVQLFIAREFPGRWKLESVLLEDIEACDATLFADNSSYWLFMTVPRRGVSPHEELHLYSSRSLRGPYEPHPKNPIVSDVRTARPAGALFRRNGRLFRPSQDCLLRYGHAIQINEVITLTEHDYSERTVDRIDPKWLDGGIATHTINGDGQYEVIDNVVWQPRFSWSLLRQ